AAHLEVRCLRPWKRNLVLQLRHLRPRVVDVRHTMRAQAFEILAIQVIRVANLYRVSELRPQRRQKRIEALNELPHALKAAPRERAELEDEQRRLAPMREQRTHEHLLKHLRIQDRFILASGLGSVARMD